MRFVVKSQIHLEKIINLNCLTAQNNETILRHKDIKKSRFQTSLNNKVPNTFKGF